jgi:hypothetical protein
VNAGQKRNGRKNQNAKRANNNKYNATNYQQNRNHSPELLIFRLLRVREKKKKKKKKKKFVFALCDECCGGRLAECAASGVGEKRSD